MGSGEPGVWFTEYPGDRRTKQKAPPLGDGSGWEQCIPGKPAVRCRDNTICCHGVCWKCHYVIPLYLHRLLAESSRHLTTVRVAPLRVGMTCRSGFPPAAQEAAQRADDLWQDLRGGAEALGTWWHEKPTCSCTDDDLLLGWLAHSASGLATTFLGVTTTPSSLMGAIVQEQRQTRFPFFTASRWREVGSSHRGAYAALVHQIGGRTSLRMQTMPPQGWKRWVGSRTETRWRVKATGVAQVGGIGGLPGSLLGGFIGDGLLQAINDGRRCLSPAERAHNMLVSGLGGVLAGVAGAAAFSGVAAVAVPHAGIGAGTGMATAASIGVAYAAANYGPLADFRDRRLIR